MGELLLVGLGRDEESLLGAASAQGCLAVSVDGLERALHAEVDAVVVGSGVADPISAVQVVHRVEPLCGAVVLTRPENDETVRRTAMFAPGMPATLTILAIDAEGLADRVQQVRESSRLQRVHSETLTAVQARETPAAPRILAPASLGALLDHAPFGVLVGDLDGRLVAWNRWAGDFLDLPQDAAAKPMAPLFSTSEYVEDAFDLARRGRLGELASTVTLEGDGDRAVELSAAPSRLENGDEALLVLLEDVTARRRAEQTRDRLVEHVGLLGRVSEALAGILDVDRLLARLAEQVVPSLADWVSLQTYDQRGQSRRVLVRHRDRRLEVRVDAVRQGLMTGLDDTSPSRRVVASGEPVLITRVGDEDLAGFVPDDRTRAVVSLLGVGSIIAVPLPGRDEIRGSMALVRAPDAPAYTPDDLAVAIEVGRRAGVALDTLALYDQQRDLAAELQRSLLTEPPENDEAEVAVRYVAAADEAQVGGDWYDAFLQPDGSTVLVIGDVMGHDTRSAAAMGQLRALLRGIGYTTGTGPAEMLSRLDAAIEGLRVRTTASGLVVRLDPRDDAGIGAAQLCWANAGHPPAIMVPPGGGAVTLENEEPDLLLGVLAHTERQERPALLEPGATLLLYTDGLVERRGESIDEGLAALTRAAGRFSDLPLETMCDRLLTELLPEDPDDDVAMVAVRLRTPGERRGVPQ